MKTIKITVKTGKEAPLLLDAVRKLDFVTSIESIESKEKPDVPRGKFTSETEFLSLCGLWKDRDISTDKIRKQLWRKIRL